MLNPKRLYNIALFYLKRYDSSSFNLKKVLKRRVYKERLKNIEIPENINEIIDDIVNKMVTAGYVNDDRYLENEIRRLNNQGKSKSFIEKKLLMNGYKSDNFSEYLNENINDEKETIKKFIKKHKLFTIKEKYQKDLAKLLRAEFSYSMVKEAIYDLKNEDNDNTENND